MQSGSFVADVRLLCMFSVLVRVAAAGVNPVDTYIRGGAYSRLPQLPYTPGSDGAGTVSHVGANIHDLKVGDRVYFTRTENSGSAAELCSVLRSGVWPLPDNMSFSEGAAIGVPYFTSYRALFDKANAKPGQTVLIHGASGAVGLAAVQMAFNEEMRVFGTASTDAGLKLVKEQGATVVFNHKTPGYMAEIMRATDGKGVNVILEMLSNVNLANDLEILAHDGTVVVIGCRGSVEINPRLMMGKESKVIGVAVMASNEDDWKKMGVYIGKGLENGSLKPTINRTYSLEQIGQAHKDVIENTGALGKLVLTIV